MKERPILFSGPMARAIIEGRKTQARRIVKHQPPSAHYQLATCISTTGDRKNEGKHHWIKLSESGYSVLDSTHPYFSCPFGHPGDRLWVRENFRLFDASKECACYDDCGCGRYHNKPVYMADAQDASEDKWKPSIHMPRWASRITLEVTAVRVERLQDIGDRDANAEGINAASLPPNEQDQTPCRTWFRGLWESINGRPKLPANKSSLRYKRIKRWLEKHPDNSWAANPWVWVVEFKRVTP